jgi:hypothetical protein
MSKPCLQTPVPGIFVGKFKGRSRIDHFMHNKYNTLCNTIGKLDTCFLFFTANDFIAMMSHFFGTLKADGVRVYIASYSAEGSESVPQDYGDMLTLVFSATSDPDAPKDMGFYYSIPPKGSFNAVDSQLDKKIANEWVKNYQTKKLRILNATVDDPTVGDTKSIHYAGNQIAELIREIQCQKATGVKAYFSSVNPSDEPDSRLAKRLLLAFILTIKIGTEETDFHIEDRDGFGQRPVGGDFDTGNPCPPAYCTTSELPVLDDNA